MKAEHRMITQHQLRVSSRWSYIQTNASNVTDWLHINMFIMVFRLLFRGLTKKKTNKLLKITHIQLFKFII